KEQSKLNKKDLYESEYMNNLWTKREQKIRNQFERITNDIINVCIDNEITEIIIGYNKNWKNGVNMGHKMNEKFYMIPYRQFINMLFYKGMNNGINVKETCESYTSKCDSLSLESINYHDNYMGKRGPLKITSKRKLTRLNKKSRGLFQSARGVLINADVNGAINIMRKGVMKRPILLDALENKIRNIEMRKICNPIRKKFQH
ncbi:MAG TPA: IS200/IS605 family accessory protein TnpB-related protein, partial [Aquella sp.]|nr:IS200/IS605 family accessory protein TnpB-related protein [Aquella sp.]